jgi:hypothetical protein
MFIKRGDGKILSVVDADAELKEKAEKINNEENLKNNNKDLKSKS